MIRGILRDFLILYICFSIFSNILSGNLKFDAMFMVAVIIVFLLTIWFLLEKFGFIPKFMQ